MHPSFYNISALTVTVNNASIRSKSTGKWFNIPLQAKTFDLVQLNNISSLLSGVKLSSGVYDNLVLHISNVTATINGTKQPVILPSGRLLITGNFNISNSTTNWVNLDFDLAHSLHITGNGEIIMMPVINIGHANENELEVNESSAIVARYPGKPRESMEFGMDQNGSMMRNFSTPQNLSINAGPGGRLEVGGPGGIPIIIRGRAWPDNRRRCNKPDKRNRLWNKFELYIKCQCGSRHTGNAWGYQLQQLTEPQQMRMRS